MKRYLAVLLCVMMTLQMAVGLVLPVSAASQLEITSPRNGKWLSYLDPPQLEWTKVSGAAGYRITVEHVDSGELTVDEVWRTQTSYPLDKALEYAQQKYEITVWAMSSKRDDTDEAISVDSIVLYTEPEVPMLETVGYDYTTHESASLFLELERDNGSSITELGFYVGTKKSSMTKYPITGLSASELGKKIEREFKISGLKPDTKYYYCAYAVNGVGEGKGNIYTFRTEDYNCRHRNGTYTNMYPEAINYKDTGSDTTHMETWYYNTYCNDCDDIVETKAVTEVYTSAHEYSKNTCKVCKHTKSEKQAETTVSPLDLPRTDADTPSKPASSPNPVTTPSHSPITGTDSGNNSDGLTLAPPVTNDSIASDMYDCEAPRVITKSADDISKAMATLTLDIIDNGGGDIFECGFYIGTTPNSLNRFCPIKEAASNGNHSVTIGSLTPDTTYYYQASAVNEGGEAFGQICSFTTQAEPVAAPPVQQVPESAKPEEAPTVTEKPKVKFTNFTFEIDDAYASADDIIIATANKPFTVTIVPNDPAIELSGVQCIIESSKGIIVNRQSEAAFSITAAQDYDHYIAFTAISSDGTQIFKRVRIYAMTTVGMYLKYRGSEGDAKLHVNYSNSYFGLSSYNGYIHDLAILASGLCTAAFTATGDIGAEHYGECKVGSSQYNARIANIADAYRRLGIVDNAVTNNIEYYGYEESLASAENNVAYSIAKKSTTIGNYPCTIVFIVLRGGGYGAEWASNFIVGSSGKYSEAFGKAADDVYTSVTRFLNGMTAAEKSNVKLLVTGYSRAAAVANITAARLNVWSKGCSFLDANDIFAYTFATPKNVIQSELDIELKLYGDNFFNNIHNIINPADLVPAVPFAAWGFTRYGTDHNFPNVLKLRAVNGKRIYKAVDETYANLVSGSSTLDSDALLELSNEVKAIEGMLAQLTVSRENYTALYEVPITRILHALFTEYEYPTTTTFKLYDYALKQGKTYHEVLEAYNSFGDTFYNSVVETIMNVGALHVGNAIGKVDIDEIMTTLAENQEYVKWFAAYCYLFSDGADAYVILNDINREFFGDSNSVIRFFKQTDTILKASSLLFGMSSGELGEVPQSHIIETYLAWLHAFNEAEMEDVFAMAD